MVLHGMLNAYWASMTAITAIGLGLFERLAMEPASAAEVARDLRLHPDGAQRLLTALAALGLVIPMGERYANGPMADATLVSGRPHYVGGIGYHHQSHLWPVWTHLETAIREGRAVLPEAFGEGNDPFATLLRTPESTRRWLEGMDAGATNLGGALLGAHDFHPHRRLIDVGGGAGTVALQLKRAWPHLEAIVLERGELCDLLPSWLAERGASSLLTIHRGDFFHPETYPQGADVALLCRVLHDWDDDRAGAILRACQRALRPGGILLVTEALLEPDAIPEPFAALSNLMMLALTGGGRERTGAHYEGLLQQAGFGPTVTMRMGGMGVIKGIKP